MLPDQRAWILNVAGEAAKTQHVWPRMAACEAALESAYGTSALARLCLNLFGMKQHVHPTYGTLSLPTREFENGEWVSIVAAWVQYQNLQECFADRMATLTRLASVYQDYQNALSAGDETNYIIAVSRKWSTDPQRASKVLAIFNEAFPPPADLSSQGDV